MSFLELLTKINKFSITLKYSPVFYVTTLVALQPTTVCCPSQHITNCLRHNQKLFSLQACLEGISSRNYPAAAMNPRRTIARGWSRTSTTLRSLAPQASASAYSATRAFGIYYLLLTIYHCSRLRGNGKIIDSAKQRRISATLQYWLLIVNCPVQDCQS